MGPAVLDCFDSDLERVEIGSGDRTARDRDWVAAVTIQTILGAVVSIEGTGTPARGPGDSESGKKAWLPRIRCGVHLGYMANS